MKLKCHGPVDRLLLLRRAGLCGPFFQNVGNGYCVRGVGNFLGPGKPGSGPKVDFRSLIPNAGNILTDVLVGTGGLANARVPTSWVLGHDGFYHELGANETGYRGARIEGAVGSRVFYSTDGGGQPIVPAPMAQYAPEAQNDVPYSYQFVGNGWAAQRATIESETEPGFSTKPATLVQLTAESGEHYIRRTMNQDDEYNGLEGLVIIFVKAGTYHICGIRTGVAFEAFNLTTGQWVATASPNTLEREAYPLGDGWYQLVARHAAYGTSNVTIGFQFMSESGQTSWTPIGTETLLLGACEYYSDTPLQQLPPIFTDTGVPLIRSKDTGTLDQANLNVPEGSIAFEVDAPTGGKNLIGTALTYDGSSFQFTDGTNTVGLAAAPGRYWVGAVWGPSGIELKVGNTWSNNEPYAGVFPGGLEYITGVIAMTWLQSVEILHTADKDWVDERVS